MSERPPLIRVEELRKAVQLPDGRRRPVLAIDELTIPAGAFVCILGPSGAGKTTLLGILGLVDQDFAGRVTYHFDEPAVDLGGQRPGARRRAAARLRRRVGFVFQDIRLRAGASALDNVRDPLVYVGRRAPAERLRVADEALGRVSIPAEDRARPVSTFSGGMQQRTAIARALAQGPALICADEPTAHLDDRLADEIYDDLKRRAQEDGITVVVVTHDRARAERYADRLVVLEPMAEPAPQTWPFRVTVEDRRAPAPPATARPAARDTPLMGRIADMAGEALAEFQPAWRALVPGRRVPAHLALPPLVAILTFGLLAGVAFLFVALQGGFSAYLDDMLHQVEAARRVRVESPARASGELVALDVPALTSRLEARGLPIAQVRPNFDLRMCALTAYDARTLARTGVLPQGVARACDTPQRWSEETAADSRHLLNLLELDPGDPLAGDIGLPPADTLVAGDENTLPGLAITRNELDWLKFGNFLELPRRGDVVHLRLRAITRVEGPDGALGRPATCVKARIAGALTPREVSFDFDQRIRSTLVHGVLRRQSFHRLLQWQHDPLGTRLPVAWRCEGAPAVTGQYRGSPELEPLARSYDVFAEDPRDALALPVAIEAEAGALGVTFDDVVNEEPFIRAITRVLDVTGWLGAVLVTVPIGVAAIILWLVIAAMLQRRRDELLLFVVMGAPRSQLRLLAFFVAALVAVPGLVLGWFGAAAVVPLAVEGVSSLALPESLVAHLRDAGAGAGGLAAVTALTTAFAAVVAASVVQSVTAANPADAFRGR